MSEKSKYKIEKNVPIPVHKNRDDSLLGIMKKMEIGDSLVLSSFTTGRPLHTLRNQAWMTAYRLRFKITTKTLSNDEIRVWRIK